MVEHVQTELTALPARVFWVILETTVRQVRLTKIDTSEIVQKLININ